MLITYSYTTHHTARIEQGACPAHLFSTSRGSCRKSTELKQPSREFPSQVNYKASEKIRTMH